MSFLKSLGYLLGMTVHSAVKQTEQYGLHHVLPSGKHHKITTNTVKYPESILHL